MPRPLLVVLAGLVVLLLPHPGEAQEASVPKSETPCTVEQKAPATGAQMKCPAVTGGVEQHPAERLYMLRVRLQREKDRNWLLVITSSSSWNFLKTDTAHTVIDGTPHEVAFRTVDAREVEGGVVEQNAIELTEAQLRALMGASSVQIRVGGAHLQLPAETFSEHARSLLSRISSERDQRSRRGRPRR